MKKCLLGIAALCCAQALTAQTKNFDLYVIAEGNFGTPNGDVYKVSRTSPASINASGPLYQTANSTVGIDVLQDFEVFGNKAVLCGKGAAPVKLAIAAYPSFDSIKTFTTIGGIQCVGKASDTKGYISPANGGLQLLDLTSNSLSPVNDPSSLIGSYASYMVQANGFMYVAMNNRLIKVDTLTSTATAAILPNIGAIAGMQYDAVSNCIWLLGKVSGTSALVKLEPANGDLLQPPVMLTGVSNAAQLRLSQQKLYFLSGKSVHIYNIAAPVIPTTAVYTSQLSGSTFSFAYGKSFTVDPATGDFALASATNFASPSIYEVVDGATFQRLDSGSVNGRIANELILRTYGVPQPDTLPLPNVYAACDTTLTPPVAHAGGNVITGITTDPLSYDQQGDYTVTWTFINGYDTAVHTQLVIIDDTTAPIPAIATLPALQGNCPYTLIPPVAADNCAGAITGTTDSLLFTTAGSYTVTWRYNDGHGNTSTQTQQLTVQCTTGIDDKDAPLPFALYPNPARAAVTLHLSAGGRYVNCEMVLSDVLGRTIGVQPIKAGDNRISLANCMPGIYFIALKKDGVQQGQTQKIVVQ
ncbi:T9SS type A sorting domain-containing protein [Taibaiella koreensis]|uniref:T9SS type A sorting domain-containing protein n=1 Tax=Taibaiella koreensis TaxID=1268548 RepID=UPI000E59EDDF|nr:T9SS type A sorting domain-containing protein [Taibaiella koreensis]